MKKVVAISALSSALTLGCFATAHADNLLSWHDLYIGAGAGLLNSNLPHGKGTLNNGLEVSGPKRYKLYTNAHVGYLFGLGYGFKLGPQVGYTYYGNNQFTDNNATANIIYQSFNLLLVTQYNLPDKFFVTANGGAGYFLSRGSGFGFTNHSTWAPMVGAGVGYHLTNNLSVQANYEHVFGPQHRIGSANLSTVPTMNLFGLGVNYQF